MGEKIAQKHGAVRSPRQGVSPANRCRPAVSVVLLGVVALFLSSCAPAAAPSPMATTKPAAAPTAAAPAASAATPTSAAASKPAPLSISAGLIYAKASFHNAPYWVAQARGIFAQKGLEVKMTDFSDPTAMMNTIGKDIDYGTPSPQMPVQFNWKVGEHIKGIPDGVIATTTDVIKNKREA